MVEKDVGRVASEGGHREESRKPERPKAQQERRTVDDCVAAGLRNCVAVKMDPIEALTRGI